MEFIISILFLYFVINCICLSLFRKNKTERGNNIDEKTRN